MELGRYTLDLMLAPLSLCLTAGYHAYVYHCFTAGRPFAAAGFGKMRARWFQSVVKDNSKKGMLGLQSLRNSLMSAILSASVAVVLNSTLAALFNNALNARHLLRHPLVFGNQAGPLLTLKYASSSMLLLLSFLCSSVAVGCIIEAGFLVNVSGEFFRGRAQAAVERGCLLAAVGSRVLFVTLSFLMWVLGPVPLALSSAALVWVFYRLDFGGGAGGVVVGEPLPCRGH